MPAEAQAAGEWIRNDSLPADPESSLFAAPDCSTQKSSAQQPAIQYVVSQYVVSKRASTWNGILPDAKFFAIFAEYPLRPLRSRAFNRKGRKENPQRSQRKAIRHAPDSASSKVFARILTIRRFMGNRMPSIATPKSADVAGKVMGSAIRLHRSCCTRLWTACTRLIFQQIRRPLFY